MLPDGPVRQPYAVVDCIPKAGTNSLASENRGNYLLVLANFSSLWDKKNAVKVRNADCAAHIGMDGMRIEKEPRQKDEYVYRIS